MMSISKLILAGLAIGFFSSLVVAQVPMTTPTLFVEGSNQLNTEAIFWTKIKQWLVGAVYYLANLTHTGYLGIVTEDPSGETSFFLYNPGQNLEQRLIFQSYPNDLEPNTYIEVYGDYNEQLNAINVTSYSTLPPNTAAVLSPGLPTGLQKTVVVKINFENDPTSIIPNEDILATMNKVGTYYSKASYGKTWFNSPFRDTDIFGTYTMQYNANSTQNTEAFGCDNYSAILNHLITGTRVSPSTLTGTTAIPWLSYKRIIVVMPDERASGCNYAGLSSSSLIGPGSSSSSILNGPRGYDAGTTAHEFGHQLGLRHAGDLECGVSSIGTDEECQSARQGISNDTLLYGDYMSVMGYENTQTLINTTDMNFPEKEKLGWFRHMNDQGQSVDETITIASPPLQLGTSGVGTYRIAPLELNQQELPKGIKIPYHFNELYNVEYRRAIDQDNPSLTPVSAYLNGVFVRINRNTTYGGFNVADTQLLDLSPAINNNHGSTDENSEAQILDSTDAALKVGKTFMMPTTTDPTSGYSIKLEEITEDYASVTVSLCGDGLVLSGEQCDDGNRLDNDGCTTTCQIEIGYTCSSAQPNICRPTCVDSDNGFNSFIKGRTYLATTPQNYQEDICLSPTNLEEWGCSYDPITGGNIVTNQTNTCSCLNGVCILGGGTRKLPLNPRNITPWDPVQQQ